jgi:hypothetical protein
MVLTLRPKPSLTPAAQLPSSARPEGSPAAVPTTTQPAAAAQPSAKPAGLRSDRFALLLWLFCVGIMSILLLKDLVVALFFR